MRIPGTTFSDIDPTDPFGDYAKARRQKLLDFVEKTESITRQELDLTSEELLFACAVEELGEYAAARIVEKGFKNKKLKESSKVEAIDLVICALSLFFANSGTVAELSMDGLVKLQKWQDRLNNKKINKAKANGKANKKKD